MNINFYEELKLSTDDSIEKISKDLIKQEKLWYSRETTKPVEARKYLFYIDEAKKVFKSEVTKKQYDTDLEEWGNSSEKSTSDTNKETTNNQNDVFNGWYEKANGFLNDDQYDLAAAAADKAIEAWYPESEDYFSLAQLSYIYYRNNQFDLALKYINDAIVLNSDYGWNYRYKYYYVRSIGNLEPFELNKLLELYIQKTEKSGNKNNMADAYAYMANEKYYCFHDIEQTKLYYEKALQADNKNELASQIMEITTGNDAIDNQISLIKIPNDPYLNKWYNLSQKKILMIPLWLVIISSLASVSGFIIVTGAMAFGPKVWLNYQVKEINKAQQTIYDLKSQYK